MRIVFFTREGYERNPLFQYIYAHVAAVFPDSHIVAVKPPAANPVGARLRRLAKITRQRGVVQTLEMLSSKPLQWMIARRDGQAVDEALNELARPPLKNPMSVSFVASVNGADSIRVITGLRPDVLLQTGAGILRPDVFSIARLATLNMHHGIAPGIRGVNSLYWALYENRPDWMGATVHRIDAGIDTGDVLAYAPLSQRGAGEGFPLLFARATEAGTAQLVDVLGRLEKGERWTVPTAEGRSEYRSSISGWRLARVELELWRERRRNRRLPPTSRPNYSSVHTNIR